MNQDDDFNKKKLQPHLSDDEYGLKNNLSTLICYKLKPRTKDQGFRTYYSDDDEDKYSIESFKTCDNEDMKR